MIFTYCLEKVSGYGTGGGEARQSPTIFIIPELELECQNTTEMKSESRVQTEEVPGREVLRSAERISGAFN